MRPPRLAVGLSISRREPLSGTIHLKSHVTLYLDQGSTILATSDPAAYDEAEPNQWDKFQDYGHSHFHNSLIWGENLDNVAIMGLGTIYGKGLLHSRAPKMGRSSGQQSPSC